MSMSASVQTGRARFAMLFLPGNTHARSVPRRLYSYNAAIRDIYSWIFMVRVGERAYLIDTGKRDWVGK